MAAFLLGLEEQKPIDECGIMAAAAGAGTALTPGVDLVRSEDFHRLMKEVICQPISL